MSRLRTDVPVVILRFHHGSLAIARSLGRLGARVHAVDSNLQSPAMATRYVQHRHEWNFGRSTDADSAQFLLDLGRRLSGRPLLIPTSDNTSQLVADYADQLEPYFRFTRNDPALVRALSNKRELYYLAQKCGIPTPATLFPQDRAAVEAFARSTQFPVMLKGADGLRLEARTGKKMVIVQSAAELLDAYDRFEDPDDPNLMLQEYIPGGDDTIWMFDGFFDDRSELVAGFTGRKLRQYPVHTGATSLGILEHDDTVHQLTTAFVKGIGYRGILDIGFRFDARDGSYRLLDPNPRIGSTFRLFVDRNGNDVARMLYAHLTGQLLPMVDADHGRKWVIEDQDLISCRAYRREGGLSLAQWLSSYRGVQETAWFARDDLRPFLRMAGGLLRQAFGRSPALPTAPAPAVATVSAHEAAHQELDRHVPVS